MANTTIQNLINPEVMADMISAKIGKAIVVTPFAKLDNTLAGQAGSTISVPRYDYIGDAADVAEGGDVGDVQLTASAETYTIKKAAKGITLTDEALLSAFGNPVGEANNQLAQAIAAKIDSDALTALYGATKSNVAGAAISYNGIVETVDLLQEEMNQEKVMFIHPAQLTKLRKDSNFVSADKYPHDVIMTGEIGIIANCHIVPSRRVAKVSTAYVMATSTTANAKQVKTVGTGASGAAASGEVLLATVKAADLYPANVADGDYVVLAANSTNSYVCPIVQIEADDRTQDEVPAITIYTKRDTTVETQRDAHHKTTYISADKHYVSALTNAGKVVLGVFTAS